MATITLTGKDPATVTADALVVGVVAAEPGGRPGSGRRGRRTSGGPRLLGAPEALRAALEPALAGLGVTGRADEVVRVPSGGAVAAPVVALTGLGPVPAPDAEALRRAAGAAVRALAGTRTVALALPADDEEQVAAVAEGALLGAYAFTRYRRQREEPEPVQSLQLLTSRARAGSVRAAVERAAVVAESVHLVRDLVNTPPADLYPAAFATAVQEEVSRRGLDLAVTVLDERRLSRGGYGGLVAVGQGSVRPPRLVRVDWKPAGAITHLALVGKGITFDSGGLSIKTASGMETMKCDMAGAAAVLGTVLAVAALKLPVRVSAWLALAENMPSGTAQRPSDVITIRGGRTVEVLNTDAEGRLVLADALVAAGEAAPDLMVDVATLTGAQMVALGNRVSAVMANDDAFRDRVEQAARVAGEQFWPMPLPAELRPSLDSPVADLANMGDRYGGMLVAGLFLAEFVPAGDAGPTPWAHLDIAGPAFNSGGAWGYTPAGGTGVAVRTLLALAEDIAS